MAVSYKGLTIKFGGDTTGLQNALKQVQSETRKTNADLKEIDRSLKFNPGNTDLLAQKVRALNKAYEETKTKLDAYRQAMQQLEDKKARGEKLTEQEQRQYESLQRSVLQCENQLEHYGKQLGETGKELEASKTKLYQVGQKLEDNADKFQKHGERMETVGKAMMGTSAAITGASLAAFNEVDAGMDAVVKATGATGDAAAALGESVKNVATTVAGSSHDWETVGNTVGEVNTRFGATGQELEGLSELFFKFSEITGVDSVQAVQNASMAMQAFGVDSSHTNEVLGVFAKVAQDSGVSADTLMQSVVTNGATFREMGLDIDDAAVMLGRFEQAGVPADQMLAGLKKAATNCAKSGDDLGQSLVDLTRRLQDPATQAEATQEAIELFGSKAGMSFVDAAQSGRVNFSDLKQTLSDYGSTVSDTFEETVDGVDQINVAQKELQAAGSELGAAFSDTLGPIIHDFAGMVRDIAEAFKSLSPEQREFVAKATLVTGAAGGATLAFGKLFQAAGDIGNGLKKASALFVDVSGKSAGLETAIASAGEAVPAVSGSFSGLGSTLTTVATGPVGIIIAALAAVGLAFKTLWDTNEGFRNTVTGIWDGIVSKFNEAGEKIGAALQPIAQALGVAGSDASQGWDTFFAILGKIWEFISNILGPGIVNFIATASAVIGGIVDVVSGVFQVIGGIIQGFQTGDWTMFTDGLKSIWDGFVSILTSPIQGAIEAIKYTLAQFGINFDDAVAGLKSAWDGFVGFFKGLWDGIKTGVSDFCDNVKNTWNGLKDTAQTTFANIKGEIDRNLSDAKTVGESTVNMFSSALKGDWQDVENNAKTIFGTVDRSITDHLRSAKDSGLPIVSDLASGALEKWEWLKKDGVSAFGDLASGINDKLGDARTWAEEKGREIQEFWESIPDKIAGFFSGIGDRITEAFGSIHFPSPHVEWDSIGVGDISIPIPNVQWYAKGGAIAPNSPHLIGVGDSREREWIEPESKLLSLIENAVRNVGGAAEVNVEVNVDAKITGRQSAYEVGQDIGRGISSVMKQRGYSYA